MASYHATPCKEMLTTYKAWDFGTVKIGNTSHSNIVEIGDVCIQTDIGCTLMLKDVRHNPDLQLNLVYGTSLDRAGYESYFGNDRLRLTKGSLIIARGKTCNIDAVQDTCKAVQMCVKCC